LVADCLNITDIRAYGYTGLLPEEQTLGQWFTVELKVWLDLRPAAQSDAIEDTYDYSAVIQEIQALIQTSRFKLIERLAEAIATHILQSYAVQQVQVRLTKVSPPVPHFTGSIIVEITRDRPSARSQGIVQI